MVSELPLSEFLDVRGTTKVVGLVTASDVFVSGVATISDIKVGSAISITGGGIQATNFMVMVQLYLIYLHHSGRMLM